MAYAARSWCKSHTNALIWSRRPSKYIPKETFLLFGKEIQTSLSSLLSLATIDLFVRDWIKHILNMWFTVKNNWLAKNSRGIVVSRRIRLGYGLYISLSSTWLPRIWYWSSLSRALIRVTREWFDLFTILIQGTKTTH